MVDEGGEREDSEAEGLVPPPGAEAKERMAAATSPKRPWSLSDVAKLYLRRKKRIWIAKN